LFVIFRFLANFLVTQYAKFRDKTDIIICETDTVLHPSVYVTYYHPWTKKLKNSIRFQILNRLFGPRKNFVIFYLDTDPTIAMERIQKRNTTFDRHENIDDLRMLKTDLDAVVEVALKSGVQIVKIDTNGKTRSSICRDMERVLRERFSLTLSLAGVVDAVVL
jgi:thymidylate kinase